VTGATMGKGYSPDRQGHAIARYAEDDGLVESVGDFKPEPSPCDEILRRLGDVNNDFSIFWRHEADPEAKQQLLQLVFERAWLDHGRVGAVRPEHAFAPSLQLLQPKTAAKSDV
jgi:hypothetical protein